MHFIVIEMNSIKNDKIVKEQIINSLRGIRIGQIQKRSPLLPHNSYQ